MPNTAVKALPPVAGTRRKRRAPYLKRYASPYFSKEKTYEYRNSVRGLLVEDFLPPSLTASGYMELFTPFFGF